MSSSAEKTMDEPSPAKWLSDNKSGSAAVSPSTSTSIATLFEEGTSERTSDRTRQHACRVNVQEMNPFFMMTTLVGRLDNKDIIMIGLECVCAYECDDDDDDS